MDTTVLIPHFRTLKMTAYSVAQYIKFKGKHNLKIIVIDNSYPDESINGLEPFKDEITIIPNTNTTQISSHGVAYEIALPYVTTEYFMTAESDSFPTNDKFIDYYENLINNGFEWGGSLLRLSGGSYVHPCGSFFKKSLWEEAKEYCSNIEYSYFPNMWRTDEGFDFHLMVHNRILDEFVSNPNKYITVSEGYRGLTKEQILEKKNYYSTIVCAFHNGMGNLQERLSTFGQRNIASDAPNVILNNESDFIRRVGYEPGQNLCYWLIANGKQGAIIPTEIKWMRNRGWQQQEFTTMENGFKHLWGVSAYHKAEGKDVQDVIDFKANQVEQLYNSLPNELKFEP